MTTVVQTPVVNSRTLFPDQAAIVAQLRATRLLMAAASVLPGVQLEDSYIYAKVIASERELSRTLKVDFVPHIVVPENAPQSEIDALEAGEMPWKQEPAYDYSPEMWTGDRWSYIRLRSKPVLSIESVRFVYPSPGTTVFDVPREWFKPDRKYGHLQLVPVTSAYLLPMNSIILSAMTGARHIPQMIQVRYTAGLKDALNEWPDLVDVILRKAVLKIVMESYVPASGSISADGLSQSMSIDLDKYADSIETAINGPKGSNGGLMTAIHGIRNAVM